MKSIANKIQTRLEAQLTIKCDAYFHYIKTSGSLSSLDTRKQSAEATKHVETHLQHGKTEGASHWRYRARN